MRILAVSGKKQSGKSVAANFIVSAVMSDLKLCSKAYIDDDGNILVSDLLGSKNYGGVFHPCDRTKINTDTVITEIFERLDPIVRIYNFADVLKQDICINILGLKYRQCYGTDDDKNEPTDLIINNRKATAREIMQYVGTDIFRNIKKDVWVSATINKIILNQSKVSIISDCRFPNEVDSIKKLGGEVLRLKRNKLQSDHISETILDKENYDWLNFNYVIDNTETSLHEYLQLLTPIARKLFT